MSASGEGAEWKDDGAVLVDAMGGNRIETGIFGSDLVQGAGKIVAIDPATGQV